MPRTARTVFWRRTKTFTLVLLALWLLVNLLLPWFARALDPLHLFGFPVGYGLVAIGALVFYLVIIVVYVLGMDRLEARCLRDEELAEFSADPSEPGRA